ncbi:hypothetical protein MBLNU459_g1591t2 [Dothideomycetes sp. NU459]
MARGDSLNADEEATLPPQTYHDDASDDETLLPADSVESLLQDDSRRSQQHTWTARLNERIPDPLKRASSAVARWVKGPQPPRPYKIEPFWPSIQHAPIRLLDRYAPKRMQRFWLLMLWYLLWLLSFSLILHKSAVAADVPGYVLNPHAVGDQEVLYKALVVGGPTDNSNAISSTVYRGDSFICGAAIHAGFIKGEEGGCGVLDLIGDQHFFPASNRNGIQSIGFDSYFPQSFRFKDGTQAQCKDLRWPLLAVSVFFTSVLSLFTTSPAVFFWSIFVGLFFQTGLASDPPNLTDYYSLISTALGRFLPAAFVMAVMFRFAIRHTLTGLTAQVEKTVLWLGASWIGALNNYTFDRIPIERLTPHDIKAQPGAVPALICVVLVIFFIALGQAWAFRVEGRMPRYLVVYAIFVGSLLLLLAVPGMNLRIHHYILAILLLPGTAFQNRPSLLYQGLLAGLFINGIARWGFDSILQTPGELLGDAQQGTLLPSVSVPVIGSSNVTFSLGPIPSGTHKGWSFDGLSVLVNDVERFREYEDYDNDKMWHDGKRQWTWNRHDEELPEYFRFAYMSGNRAGDYTKAALWLANGTWVPMRSGPSK